MNKTKQFALDAGVWSFRVALQFFEQWSRGPPEIYVEDSDAERILWRKDGHTNLHILWICNDNTANNPYNIRNAINKFTDHECRQIQGKMNYLKYPTDGTIMACDITRQEFIDHVHWADIIHFNESVISGIYPPEANHFFKDGTRVDIYKLMSGNKKVFRHSNGTYYRNNYNTINGITDTHNMYKTVSTPDLIHLGKHNIWLPQPIPLWKPQYKKRVKFGSQIVISHSPTNREIKGTDLFIKVTREQFPDTKIKLIENMVHGDCLKARQKCLVHYDQYMLGAYGVSSLEALSLGQVCIVGLSNIYRYIPDHPFIEMYSGDYEGMQDALQRAIDIASDKQLYTDYVKRAQAFLHKYHSDKSVVRTMIDMYERAGFFVR